MGERDWAPSLSRALPCLGPSTRLPEPSCEQVAEEISINMSYYYYF